MNKKLVAGLLAGSLLAMTAVAFRPSTTQAATLSGGSYTYVIDGEEVAFALDPISQNGGLLLPLDLFTQLGVSVTHALERTFTLSYGPVLAEVTVGRAIAQINGEPRQLSVAPIRLSGRLFLPSDLLIAFGFAYEQNGSFVTVNRYVDGLPELTKLAAPDWQRLKNERTVRAAVRADSGIYFDGEFSLLNRAMLVDQNLAVDFGTRTRLLGMLETNSLVLVSLSNRSLKSGALATAGAYLVDAQHNQYEVSAVLDIGDGLVSGKLAPSASRTGVLVLNKIPEGAGPVKLYYENNGAILGMFAFTQ